MSNYDFSGWATRANLKCSDGRTILKDAFKDNDGAQVPLVWNHQHNDPLNVLGHALLENRKDGVYAYCKFNDTETGREAKKLVQHGDVSALSIYANQLKQNGSNVVHGAIREVSLVLAGANPGAYIDSIMSHSDDGTEDAIIYTGEYIEYEDIYHSDVYDEEDKMEEKTVGDIFEDMTEEQQEAVLAIADAVAEEVADEVAEEILENINEDEYDDECDDEYDEGDYEEMKHNLFENEYDDTVLEHSAMETIINDAKRCGSMKESFLQHADEYGIENIDWLFPEAKNVNGNTPGFIKRQPDGWVNSVMTKVHHTPFSRIKMMFADLREDEARAKGYIKGKLKKEEVFGLLKRTVEPTTVYKKQKLDRDDIVDITDFEVVSWLKGEMRMMLDEEIARAILFGDGRSTLSEDKISETNIIPVWKDADLYTIKSTVTPATGESEEHAFITTCVKSQDDYEGSGNTTLYTSNKLITRLLLMEDKNGRRMYKDTNDLALALNVNSIVKVPASIIPDDLLGLIVDLNDYNVGADKGGEINMFDDFDIDYNQQKYLIETRCSGALTKPYSAIALKKAVKVEQSVG